VVSPGGVPFAPRRVCGNIFQQTAGVHRDAVQTRNSCSRLCGLTNLCGIGLFQMTAKVVDPDCADSSPRIELAVLTQQVSHGPRCARGAPLANFGSGPKSA